MKKYPLIGVCIIAMVLVVLGSLTNVIGYQTVKSPTMNESPLFSLRTKRAIHQESGNTINSKFLGKDNENILQFPIRESNTILIRNFIEKIIEMENKELNRSQSLVISDIYGDKSYNNIDSGTVISIQTEVRVHSNGFSLNQFDKNSRTTAYQSTLSGYVTDSDMNPIEGARIRVYFHDMYREDFSDSTGHYQVSAISNCNCSKNVSCSKLGYYPGYIELVNDESTTHDFGLTPIPIYPELSGTVGENGWYVSDVTATFIANGFVSHFYYALDEGPWIDDYTLPFVIDRDGEHFLHWFWVDDQGNSSDVYWVGFKIDKTAPTVTITVTALNRLKTMWLINATVFEEISGVKKVEFYIDNNVVGTNTNPPYEMFWRGWMFGKIIKTIAYDDAGNSVMTSRHAMSLKHQQRQSQNQPGGQQSSMGTRSQNAENVVLPIKNIGTTAYRGTLSGYVTDSVMRPVEGARIRVYFHDIYRENFSDSTGYYQITDVPLCSCLKESACSMLGYYTDYVWLTNNESITHNFVLTQTPIYPVLTGSVGENGWFISSITVTFAGNGSSNHSYYALDENPWTEYTASYKVGTEGKHLLHWFWVDDQGNSSDVYWVGFKIDKTAPMIEIIVTAQNLFKSIWLINATVEDATSGVVLVEFYVADSFIGSDISEPWDFLYLGTDYPVQAIAYDAAGNSAITDVPSIFLKPLQNQIHDLSNSQQIHQLLYNLIYNIILHHQIEV
jgi:protocatechuate 3,4-dioxygenase beta subunit